MPGPVGDLDRKLTERSRDRPPEERVRCGEEASSVQRINAPLASARPSGSCTGIVGLGTGFVLGHEDDPHAPPCKRLEPPAEVLGRQLAVIDVNRNLSVGIVGNLTPQDIAPGHPLRRARVIPDLRPALARRLLDRFGSIEGVLTAGAVALSGVSGIGAKKAARIRQLVCGDVRPGRVLVDRKRPAPADVTLSAAPPGASLFASEPSVAVATHRPAR